jgi:BON domain
MVEMMFGAGSPMWTVIPPAGVPYPLGFGPRPMTTPTFGSQVIPGGLAGAALGSQAVNAPGVLPTTMYGYGGALAPNAQPGLSGPGLAVAYPFASHPMTAPAADPTGVVTAAGLLTAVAAHRGQPQGPTNDTEVEEFIYDALDLIPGAADVEIRCESGRVTLTGTVQHKRTKRDVGEIAWSIPGLQDVQNNVTITSRRRARAAAGREAEAPAALSARKQG